jgi:hygromycin-B 7''-O-kinase
LTERGAQSVQPIPFPEQPDPFPDQPMHFPLPVGRVASGMAAPPLTPAPPLLPEDLPAGLLPSVPDMDAYRKVYKDPGTWLPAMRLICRRHGLDPAHLYAETTGTNAVFRVAGGPWIKLFAPLWPEDFVRERVGLRAVSAVEGMQAPLVLLSSALGAWPYLILSHVEGQPIRAIWPDLRPGERVALAAEMGALMARLQRGDLSGCSAIREDGDAFLMRCGQTAVARNVEHGLPPAWRGALEAYVPEALALLDRPFEPVFLHADLTDDHWFVREQDGAWHITGLIDFGDAMVGDPLYEFAAPALFLTQGQPAVQRALLRGYGLADDKETDDKETGARIRAWTLLHRFSLVRDALRCGPEPRPRSFEALLEKLWHGD